MGTKHLLTGKTFCLILLPLLPLATKAHAASDGLYAGANVGWSKFDNNNFTESHRKDTIGFGGFIGYQFSPWFSLEGGANSLGSVKGNDGQSIDVQGITLSSKFTYSLSGQDLYGRVGGMWYRSDMSNDDINKSEVGAGIAPLLAIGVEHSWSPNMTSRIEYQWTGHIDNDAATSATLNNGYLSLGITWHFGQASESMQPSIISHPVEDVKPPISETVPLNHELVIYYPFNQYILSENNRQKIIDFYHQRKPDSVTKFNIDGYSDITGSEKNNFIISSRRADNVRELLLEQGINKKNISVHAHGSTSKFNKHLSTKHSLSDQEENYSLNRRVSIQTD